jgi:hypothetical protein
MWSGGMCLGSDDLILETVCMELPLIPNFQFCLHGIRLNVLK